MLDFTCFLLSLLFFRAFAARFYFLNYGRKITDETVKTSGDKIIISFIYNGGGYVFSFLTVFDIFIFFTNFLLTVFLYCDIL